MTRNKELIVPRGMEASKMSWMALPVEPACIGKTCGGKRGVRPCSLDWLDRQIIYKHIRRYECLNGTGWIYCIPYEGNEHLL